MWCSFSRLWWHQLNDILWYRDGVWPDMVPGLNQRPTYSIFYTIAMMQRYRKLNEKLCALFITSFHQRKSYFKKVKPMVDLQKRLQTLAALQASPLPVFVTVVVDSQIPPWLSASFSLYFSAEVNTILSLFLISDQGHTDMLSPHSTHIRGASSSYTQSLLALITCHDSYFLMNPNTCKS